MLSCAKLVEVKIQYYNKDGNLTISDAFGKDCEEMNHPLLAFAKVNYGYENACVIEVRFIQLSSILLGTYLPSSYRKGTNAFMCS